MSIMEADQTEIIKLGTVHSWVFKISLWAMPIFSVWMVNTVLTHDRDIAVLKMQIAMQGHGKVSQNVNVGQNRDGKEPPKTARTWLTTQELAEREGCDERTILNYIAAGQIEPAPVKVGKSWQIAEDFRIVPKDSECGGTVANAKLKPDDEEEAKP